MLFINIFSFSLNDSTIHERVLCYNNYFFVFYGLNFLQKKESSFTSLKRYSKNWLAYYNTIHRKQLDIIYSRFSINLKLDRIALCKLYSCN